MTRHTTSRRWLLGVTGSALLTAACSPSSGGSSSGAKSAPSPSPSSSTSAAVEGKAAAAGGKAAGGAPNGALGVNFNEDPSELDPAQLTALTATWVRGFVPMTPAELGDDVTRQRAVAALLKAGQDGRSSILSLKFPFRDLKQTIPQPGSAAMAEQLKRVDRVLAAVLGKVDILTIGNEPFLETKEDERDKRLNVFYEHVARHVIDYRAKHGGADSRTRLYMGALNHLDDPKARTPATERWLRFVHRTPELDGVDIHPHVTSLKAADSYVNYVLPHLRADQKFLVTEFSLVQFWQLHMKDTVSPAFAKRYADVDAAWKVWQVVEDAIKSPFPQEKWDAFVATTPWLDDNKTYLTDQMKRFRDTGKLAVATYAAVQIKSMATGWGPDKMPWILNPVYANRTVARHADGTAGRNVWFDQFKALTRVG
ncbi:MULTISPECIES: hypothetical protein [unclassified Streptomyces]|uniref:hypothetical protein n=1 Tax=unclassified Streptomyces TaxID=2593676 RepID=UPI00278C5EAF|nr:MULTISPECIES: hypothetical protein [unclassified Streptomyces]